jgi:methionine-rich copper-binding protein CopC
MAHAYLDHAEPKVGSEIGKAPSEVKVWFSEEIEPAFSKLVVEDSTGKQIDKGDTHVDSNDSKLLIVSLPALGPGEFKVTWNVVAKDTHRTHGDFKFTIKTAN